MEFRRGLPMLNENWTRDQNTSIQSVNDRVEDSFVSFYIVNNEILSVKEGQMIKNVTKENGWHERKFLPIYIISTVDGRPFWIGSTDWMNEWIKPIERHMKNVSKLKAKYNQWRQTIDR